MPALANAPAVAFQYNGTDVTFDKDRMVSLTAMWKAAGSPTTQTPKHWRETPQADGFIENLAQSLNSAKSAVIKARRGKGVAGTWGHWQVALAYAKYLSHDFHRFVNEAFREWAEEKADPGLKMERAVEAYKKMGRTTEWIKKRLRGISARTALTATMADHNCKNRGPHDNAFAEGTRAISLQVIGKTPREFKASKGLPANAATRNHFDEIELVATEWAEMMARKLIIDEAADGNAECVDRCRRAGRAVKVAFASLSATA